MSSNNAPSLWGQTFKTGNRVPVTGDYRDQRGEVITLWQHTTFPPLCGKNSGGGCAYYLLVAIR